MPHGFGMPPAFVSGTQAQPQPAITSRSRYFHNGLHSHSTLQNRSRLSPLPSLARSSGAMTSSQGIIQPLQIQQQPYPFFAGGPAARGYIPQQAQGFSRYAALQEPIVPLRQEFSAVHTVRNSSERPVFSPGPEQIPRSYSVPTHYAQTSRFKTGHSARAISRPASAIQPGARRLVGLSRPNTKLVLGRNGETLGPSPTQIHDLYSSRFEDEFIPPKRTLPFPTSDKSKVQNAHAEVQPEGITTESPLLEDTVPELKKQAKQDATKKEISSRSTAENDIARLSQSQLLDKPKTGKKRGFSQSQNDNMQVSKRPTKIKLVSRSADDSRRPPLQEYRSSASIYMQSSQEPRPNLIPRKGSQDESNSWTLGSAHLPLTRTRESSCLHITKSAQDLNTGNAPVARSSVVGHPPSTSLTGSSPSNHQDKIPSSEIEQQTLHGNTSTHIYSHMPENTEITRPASQASTLSTMSTQPLCSAGGKDKRDTKIADSSNTLLMTDTPTILERDISDIVTARLRDGNPDLLDAVHGEILIKMASGDDVLFEAISKILKC